MRVKCEKLLEGPGPNESVVSIKTTTGDEEVVISSDSIENGTIEVGAIAERNGSVLVELPKESVSGNWRIWVSNGALR